MTIIDRFQLYSLHCSLSRTTGQFWNIPVDIAPFAGQLRAGESAKGLYTVTLTTAGKGPRSFTGWLHSLTWEAKEAPCLYVGDGQSGPVYEVIEPNDGVIASTYSDYQVEGAFSEEEYAFGRFNKDRCFTGTG